MPTTFFKILTAALALTGAAAAAAPHREAPAAATCAAAPVRHEVESCREAPGPAPRLLRSKMRHQMRYHQHFPASRPALLASLRATTELTADEQAWIAAALADRSYDSGAEVLGLLFP